MKALVCLCLLFYLISCRQACAIQEAENKQVFHSGVAKGFDNGLHSKYLKYFADKLSVEIEISSISFARRVQLLKSGKLDLMVGLQRTENREDEFVYILPHYETLRFRYYVLKDRRDDFNTYSDLKGKVVGINRHAKYFSLFDSDESITKYPLSTLEQNIEMLLRGRIDSFIHYGESAYPILAELGLEDKIVQMKYQPQHEKRHYLVISKHSPLIQMKAKLENIIKNAIAKGELLNIRLAHYRQNSQGNN